MAEKLYQDKDWLTEQYWEQQKTLSQIAGLAGCSKSTIATWMEKFGISRRTCIEASHLRSQNPNWRKAQIKAGCQRAQDPEWQRKQTEKNRRMTQNPKWRRAVTEANRHRAKDPEYRKKHGAAMRRLAQDSEWQTAVAEANRRKAQNPEYRKNYIEGRRRMAQNPQWREAMRRRNRRLALKRRRQGEMTDIEAIVYNALQALGLEEGKDFDFEVPIKGSYTADFVIYSHNIVLEAYGRYWHTLPGKQEYDAERKQFLGACGYTVLEWWGPDIKADVWKLIDEELLPLLDRPSRIERPPRGVSKPYKGKHGWRSAVQLYLFGKEQGQDD